VKNLNFERKFQNKSKKINANGIKRMLIITVTKKIIAGSIPKSIPSGIEPLNSIPGKSVSNITYSQFIIRLIYAGCFI